MINAHSVMTVSMELVHVLEISATRQLFINLLMTCQENGILNLLRIDASELNAMLTLNVRLIIKRN
jgi:hypothetical protein